MKKLLFIVVALITTSLQAGTLVCSGTVEKIGLHAPDKIMLKLSSMNTAIFICNPNTNWTISGTSYTTSAKTCSSMLAMFMHAKATNASVGSVYFDGAAVPTSCDSWANWSSANIRFFLY